MNIQKLIIAKSGCKDLGNELVNHMSVYAYGLEVGAEVVNHSGYGYTGLLKALHALYARYINWRHAQCTLRAWRAPVFLPPTKPLPITQNCDTLYLFGWVFRNPLGLETHRADILKAFAPTHSLQEKVDHILSPWKGHVRIGVHLRQKNFKGFPAGEFIVPAMRVRAIVDEYLKERKLRAADVMLVIVSDVAIPEEIFKGFPVYQSLGNTLLHFFLLSRCTVVIGTNTVFPNLAAWVGHVAHIVTTNDPIEWTYYTARDVYFENKYATFAY